MTRQETLTRRPRNDTSDTLDESALDTRLSPRVRSAIQRIWGHGAKKRDLLQPDAWSRLRQVHGLGPLSMRELDETIAAWGLGGLGGKDTSPDRAETRRLVDHGRLRRAFDDLGAVGVLNALADISAERLSMYTKRPTSGRRRSLVASRAAQRIAYYTRCQDLFALAAAHAPALEDVR